jgi:hypothetical protein
MEMGEREPAEVFCLAEFLYDEMEARGWQTDDVAARMGGADPWRDLMVLNLIMCVHKDALIVDDATFRGLARAFDVSEDMLRNLDAVWRRWPERRSAFTPPESIFGEVSRATLLERTTH